MPVPVMAARAATGAAAKAKDNPGTALVVGLIAVLAVSRAVKQIPKIPKIPKIPNILETLGDILLPPAPEYWNPFEEFYEEDLKDTWGFARGVFDPLDAPPVIDPVVVPRPTPVVEEEYYSPYSRGYRAGRSFADNIGAGLLGRARVFAPGLGGWESEEY